MTALPTGPQAQPSFAALRERGYRAFFITNNLATMADSVKHVISYWVVFQRFHSPALGGFAVISHWPPCLLLAVWTGSLADRRDPRRLIQIGMGLFMFVSLAWGLVFLFDVLRIWHAVALLTVHGIAGVLWGPVGQVLLYDIVETSVQTIVQLRAPSAIRGRLIGLYATSSLGMRCFAGISVGFVGASIGIYRLLALSAGCVFVVIVVLLVANGGLSQATQWN